MKTLVLIACLLAIAYAATIKELDEHFQACAQELNKSVEDVEVAHCALQKEGLIDEKGMYLIDKSFALLDELVSDETKRNEAKEIIRKCYDEAGYETEGDINQKTMKGIQCGIGALSALEKGA